MEERVWFDLGDGVERHGTIIGITSEYAYGNFYIVLLDIPMQDYRLHKQRPCRAIQVIGGLLRSKFDVMS